MPTRTALAIALRALRRNRLQTSLTITGMTIGVAAVLTMIAIGTGAETAIEDQIRAAGMNLIVVTAGNYKVKSTDDFGGGAVEPSAALSPPAARGESLAAFDGRCIPAGCVAPPSNAPGILGRPPSFASFHCELRRGRAEAVAEAGRALPAGRVARLGATPDFHQGRLDEPALRAAIWDPLGARPSNAERTPSRRATRANMVRFARVFAGDAGPRGACSRFSDTVIGACSPVSDTLLAFHPEDDPMEKHNHPTARQRLGDSEAGLGSAATLTAADADAIRRLRGVQYVAEGLHQNVHVKTADKRWFTRLHGTDLQLPLIRRAWTFGSGRFFSAGEQSRAEQVIVLGAVAAQRVFGDGHAVGRDVTIWNQPFRVVGVVTTTSWMVAPAPGDDQFDAVYIPFSTVHRLLNLVKLNDITITAASTGDVSRIMGEVTKLLRARHSIGEDKPDDFTVTTQARQALAKGGMRPDVARAVVGNVGGLEKVTLEQLGKTLDRATRTMTALLAGIAAVSLLVGGIGIMNVMLLSVTERTREIGIRRAVGARARDVRSQFVIEAVALSLAGGIIGVIVGLVSARALSQYLRWSTTISPGAVLLSVGVAAAVGIFFGWYPAKQAAGLDPIQSLRYE